MSRAASARPGFFAIVAVAAAIVLAVGAAHAADTVKSRFRFSVPSGWVDKSPANNRDFLTMAFDEAHQLAFQASVNRDVEAVTPQFLDQWCNKAAASLARRLKTGQLRIVSKSLVEIAGVHAARFVFELSGVGDDEQSSVRELQYYLPAHDQAAVLTFTAPGDTYDKYERLFDKTARSTKIRK